MFYFIELLKFYLLWHCAVHPSLTYLSLDRMWDHLQKLLISPSSVPFFSAKFYSVYCQYFFLSKSYDNRKSKFLDCLRFIIHDSISFTIIIINIVLRHYYSSSVYSLIFCWSSSDKDGWFFYYLKNPLHHHSSLYYSSSTLSMVDWEKSLSDREHCFEGETTNTLQIPLRKAIWSLIFILFVTSFFG